MAFAIIVDGQPVEIQPGRPFVSDGVQYPANWLISATPDDLTAAGVRTIVEPALPQGKVSTGSSLTFASGKVRRVHTLADLPPPPVPQDVTEVQFIRACVRAGFITAIEGEAYLARGELPAMMQDALQALPEAERIDARLKAIGSSSFSRGDGVFAAIVAAGVATSEQVDAVFRLAASLD